MTTSAVPLTCARCGNVIEDMLVCYLPSTRGIFHPACAQATINESMGLKAEAPGPLQTMDGKPLAQAAAELTADAPLSLGPVITGLPFPTANEDRRVPRFESGFDALANPLGDIPQDYGLAHPDELIRRRALLEQIAATEDRRDGDISAIAVNLPEGHEGLGGLDYPRDCAAVRDMIRDRMAGLVDLNSAMDTGGGMGQADLWLTINGVEYFVTVKRSAKERLGTMPVMRAG